VGSSADVERVLCY